MTNDELQAWCAEQSRVWERWRIEVVGELRGALDESNRIQSESEARCLAADKRTERRETAYDARDDRAEEREERQAKSWERLAAALEGIAVYEGGTQ